MYPRGHEGRARPIAPGDEVGNETTLPGGGGILHGGGGNFTTVVTSSAYFQFCS